MINFKTVKYILYAPFPKLFLLFLSFIKYLSIKKISKSQDSKPIINYTFESPIVIQDKYEDNYKNIVSPSLTIKLDNYKNDVFNISDFHSLDDRFCSFNKNIEFCNRKNEILLVMTKKDHLPGHILRRKIIDQIKYDKRFETLDLKRHKVKDLFDYYSKYKFIIVIENCENNSYVSEKYYDVIKSGAIPIYHNKSVKNFKHCYVSFQDLENPNRIFNKVIEFTKNNELEEIFKYNFENLKNLRYYLISNYLKYSALPFFAFSELIHKKTFFYKIHNLLFKR